MKYLETFRGKHLVPRPLVSDRHRGPGPANPHHPRSPEGETPLSWGVAEVGIAQVQQHNAASWKRSCIISANSSVF